MRIKWLNATQLKKFLTSKWVIIGLLMILLFRSSLYRPSLRYTFPTISEDFLKIEESSNTSVLPKVPAVVKCGEIWEELKSKTVYNIFDILANNSESLDVHQVFGHGSDEETILKIQTCQYDNLIRWNTLANDLGITRWVAHGGSAIGGKCFGGQNPWDDDIDITVLDCKALTELYKNGEANITSVYPDLPEGSHSKNVPGCKWISRLLPGNELILTLGSKCGNWYKLLSVEQAYQWDPEKVFIMGMDIECYDRGLSGREKSTQNGWADYMKSTKPLYTVPYGPTTMQMMEPTILNRYIAKRYKKNSPCQYPFTDGIDREKILPSYSLSQYDETNGTISHPIFQMDQDESQMNFVLENWYVPKAQRDDWFEKKGNQKQLEYTNQLPNLDKIEIDNTISSGCTWGANATIKVIGWNAERGKYWDKFYELTQEKDELNEPLVILLNEMDIGMARSGNVHTARRLALQLGMNYAYGIEFLELTRGTREEQEATKGKRDALALHGNAILSKCILGDGMILRDSLPHTYFSDRAHRGINADGFEVRLGGRMGLFARIFEKPSPVIPENHNLTNEGLSIPEELPPHFVVGNVHKVAENAYNRAVLWNYYGFGAPAANSTSNYDGEGLDLASSQHGVIIQGDFGPKFCALGGLKKMNSKSLKTFRVNCLPDGKVKIGPLSADYFCSNMHVARDVQVTPPCDWSNDKKPLTLADHAIVSIEVESNKR